MLRMLKTKKLTSVEISCVSKRGSREAVSFKYYLPHFSFSSGLAFFMLGLFDNPNQFSPFLSFKLEFSNRERNASSLAKFFGLMLNAVSNIGARSWAAQTR